MTTPASSRRWLLIGLIAAVVLGGGIYWRTARPEKPAEASANRLTTEASLSPEAAGKRVFLMHCAACHQVNGRGLPGVYPPLAGSEWVNGAEERIIRIALLGMTGPTQVKGETFNNLMTPFRGVLSDEQIAGVLTYIRQEWGNASPAVSPSAVAAIRAATSERTAPWTAMELLALPGEGDLSKPPPLKPSF
jgi:mono/diheme cytochrome c family protein